MLCAHTACSRLELLTATRVGKSVPFTPVVATRPVEVAGLAERLGAVNASAEGLHKSNHHITLMSNTKLFYPFRGKILKNNRSMSYWIEREGELVSIVISPRFVSNSLSSGYFSIVYSIY